MKDISIYVHIPFCEKKCNYCAFTSFCAKNQDVDKYIEILTSEIKSRKVENPVKTIYIGGGTPSVLSCDQISKIVGAIFDNFNVYDNAEFTVEANPNSITEEFLKTLKELRVNRLSVGVQSLSDKNLQKIGRLHDKKMALEKIKLARKCFDNVSADLIVGLEGEDGKTLCRYAKELLGAGVKHISCYLLEVYENTPIYQLIQKKKFRPLSDDETVFAFNKLANYLVDVGMNRYEISNFSFPGYESKHNLNYWSRGEYLGFGVSAHSFVENRRFFNSDTLIGYEHGVVDEEVLTKKEVVEEIIMLGLRCDVGVDLKELLKHDYDMTLNDKFNEYLKQGVLLKEDNLVRLNSVYYHVSNTIISDLIPD